MRQPIPPQISEYAPYLYLLKIGDDFILFIIIPYFEGQTINKDAGHFVLNSDHLATATFLIEGTPNEARKMIFEKIRIDFNKNELFPISTEEGEVSSGGERASGEPPITPISGEANNPSDEPALLNNTQVFDSPNGGSDNGKGPGSPSNLPPSNLIKVNVQVQGATSVNRESILSLENSDIREFESDEHTAFNCPHLYVEKKGSQTFLKTLIPLNGYRFDASYQEIKVNDDSQRNYQADIILIEAIEHEPIATPPVIISNGQNSTHREGHYRVILRLVSFEDLSSPRNSFSIHSLASKTTNADQL